MNDAQWQAIVDCDGTYDGQFYYAVATTGIFCLPSCKSRTPSRDNVSLFERASDALAAGYRPCKRCRPDERLKPNEEWVYRIAVFIEERLNEQLTLETLSAELHGSPHHLLRTFKQHRGMTPAQYAQEKRVEKAMSLLANTAMPISNVAQAVGMRSAAHFATVFQSRTGVSPTAYRRHRRARTKIEEEK